MPRAETGLDRKNIVLAIAYGHDIVPTGKGIIRLSRGWPLEKTRYTALGWQFFSHCRFP